MHTGSYRINRKIQNNHDAILFRNTFLKLFLSSGKDELILRTKQGCGAPHYWYRLHKERRPNADAFARSGESRDMNFLCSSEIKNNVYVNGTECIVTCPHGLKPTDNSVYCSCFR